MSEAISEFPCPAGDGMIRITTSSQRRTIATGGSIHHSRECQKAASQVTLPCGGCGEPVTRRRSEVTTGAVYHSRACRGLAARNSIEVECSSCGKPHPRKPSEMVDGPMYCSRACSGMASQTRVEVACGQCEKPFTVEKKRTETAAETGRPIFCSHQCKSDASRVNMKCAGCGNDIWRYRSDVERSKTGQFHCTDCHDARVEGRFKPRRGDTLPCSSCGKPVYRPPGFPSDSPRYCGHDCRSTGITGPRVERPIRVCLVCKKPFPLEPDQVRQDVKTCSRECAGALRRRKPGERYIDDKGYVWITAPDGRNMFEHRHVVEQNVGRPLLPTETVHHKTGGFKGRSNNDIGNLELWTGRHPKGHRIEDVIQYAREMLAVYGSADELDRYQAFRDAVMLDESEFSLLSEEAS